MNLRGTVHDLKFSASQSASRAEEEYKSPPQVSKKTEYHIMLKRQILKEMIFDADFNS